MLNRKEEYPGSVNLSYYFENPEKCDQVSRKMEWNAALSTMMSRGLYDSEKGKFLPGFTQYGLFFGTMLLGREVSAIGRLVSPVYFHNRDSDDRADGDRPVPLGYSNPHDYLLSRRSVIEQVFSPNPALPIMGDRADIMLVHAANQASSKGLDLLQEFLAVMDTMIIDEERKRTGRVLPEAELNNYFNKLDFGCLSGCLKIAGENVDPTSLENLSLAVRTMFNIRDFRKDLNEGIVNISREDVDRLNVDIESAKGLTEQELLTDPGLRQWFAEQTEMGSGYLSRSQGEMANLSLKRLTRFALKAHFIKPTEKGLARYQQILAAA